MITKNRSRFKSSIKATVVAFTFMLGLTFIGSTQSASADAPRLEGSISFLVTDKAGNQQTLSNTKDTDGTTYKNPAQVYYNVQKYSNLIERYTLANNTGVQGYVEGIIEFPQLYNTVSPSDSKYDPLTLVYDSSRPTDVKMSGPSTFVHGYSYDNSRYTNIFDNSKSLLALFMGRLDNGYTAWEYLDSGSSLQMQAPLTPNPNYDYSDPKSGFTRDTVPMATSNVSYGRVNVRITAYKSILLNQEALSATTYNDLKAAAQANIKKLFKSNATEEPDHSKATISITPTDTAQKWDVTYSYDGVTIKIPGTTNDLSSMTAKDFTVNYGSKWDSQKFTGITSMKDGNGNSASPSNSDVTTTIKDASGNTVTGVDTNKAGSVYTVTYTYNGISKTVKVTVGQPGVNPVRPVNPTTPATPTPTPVKPTNPNWNPSKPGDLNGTGLPNYAQVKGGAIYSVKTIYMYKHATFKKAERIAKYPTAKRTNRHMFIVIGYDRSNGGALRYKVRDVNHGKKHANKVGYITANRKYVVNVYYKTMPKSNKITVISKNGVHAYKNKNLTGKAKTYKKGSHLKVKKIVKHNLTTRYQLSNGYYVTGNKKLVIQGSF